MNKITCSAIYFLEITSFNILATKIHTTAVFLNFSIDCSSSEGGSSIFTYLLTNFVCHPEEPVFEVKGAQAAFTVEVTSRRCNYGLHMAAESFFDDEIEDLTKRSVVWLVRQLEYRCI